MGRALHLEVGIISLLFPRRDIDGYKVSISVEKTPNFIYIVITNLSSGY